MDPSSRGALSSSSLTIAKGDLMYRKTLGDRTFELMEEFGDIVCYFPSPLLALRWNPCSIRAHALTLRRIQGTNPSFEQANALEIQSIYQRAKEMHVRVHVSCGM